MSIYQRCGLCGDTIYDGFAARYRHLEIYHKISEEASSFFKLPKQMFHGVIPTQKSLKELHALKDENVYVGIHFSLGQVHDMRNLGRYDRETYNRDINQEKNKDNK
jgi:uncharacterized protein YpiB (UPF0302 family)